MHVTISPSAKFISIHALRKESDRLRRARYRRHGISIHALRKESDMMSLMLAPS